MIYLTELVYLRDGCEALFQEFENTVLPLLPQYHGELLLRLRPDAKSRIGGSLDVPYEVHLVQFDCAESMERYAKDEVRQRVLHMKAQALRTELVIRGNLV